MSQSQSVPDLFQDDYQSLIDAMQRMKDTVQRISKRWEAISLQQASPQADDPDAYVEPILKAAELLEEQKIPDILDQLYIPTLQLIDQHCSSSSGRLHKGKLIGYFAISFLNRGLYSRGIAYLYAAAQEDTVTYGATNIYGTHALSPTGIFGRWLDIVLQRTPSAVLPYLSSVLRGSYDISDVREFCLWLAKLADLRFPAALLEFSETRNMKDPHSASVRLQCLRDLAALFEVLWKCIGSNHTDLDVKVAFSDPPSLARLMCHMHFKADKKDRRGNPKLNVKKRKGLLWNSVCKSPDLLMAIDNHIDFCGKISRPITNIWQYLSTNRLSPDATANDVAKRFLLAYRLRNQTAHTFDPLDPGINKNADAFFEWLLEANLYLYLWAKETGQVSF